MNKYEVYQEPQVYRQLDKVHARYRNRIKEIIKNLADEPYSSKWDTKALGEECEGSGVYRVKLARYRVV